MTFWYCQSQCGWCVNSEDHIIWMTSYKLGICVQNCSAIIWGEGRRKEIFYILEWWLDFPPPSHNFTKRWQEGFADLSPNVTWPFWVAIWLWHPRVLSKNVKKIKSRVWKICLKAQMFVCVWGLGVESGCHFAVDSFFVLFCFVLMSKLHKTGALPRRIWCGKAQAALKRQTSKENRKIKVKTGILIILG